jgi:Sec-independent protein translocase protein TatA
VDTFLILAVVLIIALVWRGPKTLPEIGRMFGRGVREARAEAAKMSSRDEATEDQGPSAG